MLKKHFLYKSCLGILLILASLYLFFQIHSATSEVMTVSFLDIGQGDSILIETPSGTQMLVDSGLNNLLLEKLPEVIPFYDKNLDAIMMSHADADHIGGFPGLLKSFSVDNIIFGVVRSDNELSKAVFENKSQESKVFEVEEGDRIILDSKHNIYFEIFYPNKIFSDSDVNDTSIVGRLVYGEIEFMFTGDASISVEKYLVNRYKNNLASDVLKVGHHGSDTSTSLEFLGFVNPSYAVISAGENNSYGHPHQEIFERLQEFEIEIFQTKDLGTIVAKTNGEEVWFEK